MANFEVMLNSNYLKGAVFSAAKSDVRQYLNGVHVASHGDETLWYESSTGEIAFQIREKGIINIKFSVNIPLDVVKAETKKSDYPILKKTNSGYCLGNTMFVPIDGTFPDLKKVMPVRREWEGSVPLETAQYNPELLSALYKSFCVAYDEKKLPVRLQHSVVGINAAGPKESAALMYVADSGIDARGCIMPWRV